MSPVPTSSPSADTLPSGGVADTACSNLLATADCLVADGVIIEAMLPQLRAAMRAVPLAHRHRVLLPVGVMAVLVRDVLAAALEQPAPLHTCSEGVQGVCGRQDSDMACDDAEALGRFWYSVAAGEIQLSPARADAAAPESRKRP